MRLIEIFEPLIAIGVLWLVINLVHAVMTMNNQTLSHGFFWVSNKIKKNTGGKNEG